MKASEIDIVRLTEDLPEYGLKAGEQLTVVEAFEPNESHGEAYWLELDDGESRQILTGTVYPHQFEVIWRFKDHQ